MEYKFCNFEEKYYDSLYELIHSVYQSNISLDDLVKHYVTGDKNILICVDISTESVVGCGFYAIENDYVRTNRILYVTYVATDERFRNQGIATNLFKHLETIAINGGCSAIEMTSANFRSAAHELYEHIGFKKKATTHFIKEMEVK